MALEYAKTYPQSVSHVVMIGIAPDLSPTSSEMAERYWEESTDAERKAVLADNLRRVTDESLADLSLSEAFVQDYIRKGPRAWYDPRFDSSGMWEGVVPNDVLFKIWGETFASIDIRKGLNGLNKPVLLALGRYDYLVAPPASWEPFREEFQDLTLRVFERSGHTPQYEQSILFDSVLVEWLDSRS
jgi:proline iminopeptidase